MCAINSCATIVSVLVNFLKLKFNLLTVQTPGNNYFVALLLQFPSELSINCCVIMANAALVDNNFVVVGGMEENAIEFTFIHMELHFKPIFTSKLHTPS